MIPVFWPGGHKFHKFQLIPFILTFHSLYFLKDLNPLNYSHPLPYLFWHSSLVYSTSKSSTLIWHFMTKQNLNFTKYLNLHCFYLCHNFGLTVKIIGSKIPCVVSQSEIVNTYTNKLIEKVIKNWSQSASSIHQNKQASQMRCRSSYLRTLAVKFN